MDFLPDGYGNGQADKRGVLVHTVLPNSAAMHAGLKEGDVLMMINGLAVNTPADVVSISRKFQVGSKVTFSIQRKGQHKNLISVVTEFPRIRLDDIEVVYGHIGKEGHRLRTVMTYPKNASQLPGVLFIQGMGCGSIDNPLDTGNSQMKLINHITRSGFVTLTVEKSGVGDSEGTPCNELNFLDEAEGYREALLNLATKVPVVDTSKIFIVGHSLGGVWAPLIADSRKVKGIAVYGTIGRNYPEYLVESRRAVAEALGLSMEQRDHYVKEHAKCIGLLQATEFDRERAILIRPDCEDELSLLSVRSMEFHKQLSEINIPSLWNRFAGSVLSVWGEMDFLSLRGDHEQIATLINQPTPERARFITIPGADHSMGKALSLASAARQTTLYNAAVGDVVIGWLREIGQRTSAEGSQSVKFPHDSTARAVMKIDYIENAYPRWIDNDNILFQSNRDGRWQIYRMRGDGTNVRNLSNNTSNDNFVTVSADGKWIAFVSDRDGNEEIYVMSIDGSDVKRLTNHIARDIHPYFSPDGNKILFNSTRDTRSNFEIYAINVDGSGLKRLTVTKDEKTCARLSPDGKRILYLAGMVDLMNDELFLVDPSGKNYRNISRSVAAEGWPTWSIDGKQVIYASDDAGTFEIYSKDLQNGETKKITTVKPPFMDARPELSPDGTKLVFNRQVAHSNGKNTIAIYVKPFK